MYVCRLGDDEMEVGMGVHGEPGASREKMQTANNIAAQVGSQCWVSVGLHHLIVRPQTSHFAVASNVHLAWTYIQVSPVAQMPLYANIWLKAVAAPGGCDV